MQEALAQMWQHEAASRAVIENGTEEGLGDSSDSAPIAFPQDMEEDRTALRNNPTTTTIRRYEDQMVPSMTTSLVRVEEEETSSDLRVERGRAEVPTTLNMDEEPGTDILNQVNNLQHFNIAMALRDAEDSTAESSSSTIRRERDGGVVPVWSPPASSYSEQYVGEENSFLQRHPQSHQVMNWTQRLSQTG